MSRGIPKSEVMRSVHHTMMDADIDSAKGGMFVIHNNKDLIALGIKGRPHNVLSVKRIN